MLPLSPERFAAALVVEERDRPMSFKEVAMGFDRQHSFVALGTGSIGQVGYPKALMKEFVPENETPNMVNMYNIILQRLPKLCSARGKAT